MEKIDGLLIAMIMVAVWIVIDEVQKKHERRKKEQEERRRTKDMATRERGRKRRSW